MAKIKSLPMKKCIFIIATVISLNCVTWAQPHSSFKYQAVVRDNQGAVIDNSVVLLKISILQDTENGNTVYSEEHEVTSNAFGLINLNIGDGTNPSGNFSTIDWETGSYFLKLEMAVGASTTLELLGVSPLLSVPYALHAETVTNNNDADSDISNELQQLNLVNDTLFISKGNQVFLPKQDMVWDTTGTAIFYNKGNVGIGTNTPSGKLEVKSGVLNNPDEIIFGVLNNAGDTVFAVYQGGVRINVQDGPVKATGSRGGFAVGGISSSKGMTNREFMRVTSDSVRIYVTDGPVKASGSRGGFAVGGISSSKAFTNEYLRVTPDSVRIYVGNNPVKASGSRGGFAVGGISSNKTERSNYMYLEPENYFIGHESGSNLTTGLYNSTLGYQSGLSISSGSENAYMGYQSGFNNQSGSGNLFLGYQTGLSNVVGNYNSFIGYKAGYSNTEGLNNSFLGSFAGQNNSTGSYNIFVGDSSGFNNTTGENNSFLGTKAGFSNVDGYQNSFIGNYAGHSNTGGYANVFIGNSSGYSNISAGGNVFIGNETGSKSIDGWNNVYIGTQTGKNNLIGEGNVFIGFQTGINNAGTRNIFIGNRAGGNQIGSNKLIIDNDYGDSTQVLIWGDLLNDKLRINANIGLGMNPDWHNFSIYDKFGRATLNLKGIGDSFDYASLSLESEQTLNNRSYVISHKNANRFGILYYDGINWFSRINIDSIGNMSIGTYDDGTEMLDVNGNARFRWVESGTYSAALAITSDGTLTTATSDSTMKKNIVPIDEPLQKVLGLNGVYFSWKNDTVNNRRVGFIAQEMEKVLPEVVFTNPADGLKGINYAELTSVLAGAIKEQQQQITNQQSEIELLKSEIDAIKSLLNK